MFFSKKSKPKNVCVLLDSANSRVLARGSLEGPPDGLNIQVNVFEGDPLAVVNAEHVQIVPADEEIPPKLGHVIHRQNTLLVFEPLRNLTGNQVRQNLRMPVDFDTFIYPLDGTPGRYLAKANDLSCGGVSFYCGGRLHVADEIQIVVPITRIAPLLLTAQVLRSGDVVDGRTFYAAKYLELLSEQESMIREAVFNVQLKVVQRQARRA